MKGFVEHIIIENAKIERELYRDIEHISAPFLLEDFKSRLPQVVNSKKTIDAYVSSINGLDQLIVSFTAGGDFHSQLQKSFENKEYDKIDTLMSDYDKEITEWLEWAHKAKDYNTKPEHIRDMPLRISSIYPIYTKQSVRSETLFNGNHI